MPYTVRKDGENQGKTAIFYENRKNMAIYDHKGRRLYTNQKEVDAFIAAAEKLLPLDKQLYCYTLMWTGCRASEARLLKKEHIDTAQSLVVIESLKKRSKGIFRAVPIPDLFTTVLAAHCNTLKDGDYLWKMGRTTAYEVVKQCFNEANIQGPQACAKGLRHGFAVRALSHGIPLNMVQKWLGHSDISTTAIYTNALGSEEREIAKRMWGQKYLNK